MRAPKLMLINGSYAKFGAFTRQISFFLLSYLTIICSNCLPGKYKDSA